MYKYGDESRYRIKKTNITLYFPTLGLLTNIFLHLFWVNEPDAEKSCVGHTEQHHKTLVKKIIF